MVIEVTNKVATFSVICAFDIAIYPTPPLKTECDTWLIFQQGTAGLNSVFLLLDWLAYQSKKYCLFYELPIVGGRTQAFPMGISLKCNIDNLIQDLNSRGWFQFLGW